MTPSYLRPFKGTQPISHPGSVLPELLRQKQEISLAGLGYSYHVKPELHPSIFASDSELFDLSEALLEAQSAYRASAQALQDYLATLTTSLCRELVKNRLGLEEGQLVAWHPLTPRDRTVRFELRDLDLDYVRDTISVRLGGPARKEDMLPYGSRLCKSVSFSSWDEAAAALQLPDSSAAPAAPADLPLDLILEEIKLAPERLARARFEEAHSALLAYDSTRTSSQALKDEYAKQPLLLEVYVTGRGNLVIEWYQENGKMADPLRVAMMMGYYRPHRLLQLSLHWMLRPYERWNERAEEPAGERERMHDLLVRGLVLAAREVIQRLQSVCQVKQVLGGWPFVARTRLGVPGDSWVGLATRAIADSSHSLERLTGLTLGTLEELPYDWKAPGEAADANWAKTLTDAGGNPLTMPLGGALQQEIVEFYRYRDPAVAEERRQVALQAQALADEQAAQAEAEKKRVAQLLLRKLNIGHRTGWSKAFAQAVGIHPTDVKRWLKKNLPLEFLRMYPDGKGLADFTRRESTAFIKK